MATSRLDGTTAMRLSDDERMAGVFARRSALFAALAAIERREREDRNGGDECACGRCAC